MITNAGNGGSASGGGRDVIFRLRLENDPRNRAAAEELAKTTETAQEKIRKNERETDDARERAAREERRREDARQRAIEKALADQERFKQQATQANFAVAESASKALDGVAGLARGFVLLGVASEEDLEKAVRVFAKFEAGVQVFKGLKDGVIGTAQAMQAYKVSTQAAAAAQTAANTAAALGGTAAGAGGAGAAGAGAASVVGGGAAAVGVTVGAFAAAIASATAALWSLGEVISGNDTKLGSLTNTIAEMEVGAQEWLFSFDEMSSDFAVNAISTLGLGGVTGLLDFGTDQAAKNAQSSKTTKRLEAQYQAQQEQTRKEQAERSFINSTVSGLGGLGRGDPVQEAERMLNLEKERLQTVQQLAAERSREMAIGIQGLERQRDAQFAIAQQQRDALLSAKERFGQLSYEDQQKAIRIKQRADRGEKLSREDRSILRGIGTQGTAEIARAGDLASADKAGFEDFFGSSERQNELLARRGARQAEVLLRDQRELKVEFDTDTDAIAGRLADQIAGLAQSRDQEIIEKVRKILADRLGDDAANRIIEQNLREAQAISASN